MRPGDLAIEYAKRMEWTLRPRNIMVEGDSDVRFFLLANKLYELETKHNLLGEDISLFACGYGDSGGTYGMFEQLPPLLNIIRSDPDKNGKVLFRVIALVDNDYAGRILHRGLTQQYRQLKTFRDIFTLNRILPRTTSEPNALAKQIEKHNKDWKGLDCEIEDLLGDELVELFLDENPNAFKSKPVELNGRCHYEWTDNAKGKLYNFTKEYASLNDIVKLVEILKSLRFYLGLPADGI
ncbi:MAG: hypothetical protein PHI97_28705 [Desulfobulbus sp.]|nr:hypothetical protein [Desulfobulbus sp.]